MTILIKSPVSADEFELYYRLRWAILRAPWGQPEGSEQDDIENECIHVMACDENNSVLGIGRLQFNSDTEAQIRYMAVAQAHERQGLGRQLITALESAARSHQCQHIVLDAREPATGFYRKQGYQLEEKTYLLFDTIQHYRMTKFL